MSSHSGSPEHLEMQLKIAWDALGEIVQQSRYPENERSQSLTQIARDALEKLNENNIKRRAENEPRIA